MNLVSFSKGRESRKACVSGAFPSQNLCHKQLFFFPVSLHIAAPNPQAGFFFYSTTPIFSLSFGSVVNAVLFCFQPPSPHLLYIAPHLTHTVCMADQSETFICRTLQTQSRHQKRHMWNDNNAALPVLPFMMYSAHHETSLADHCVPHGQPANQPADTEDPSITHGFTYLVSPFSKPGSDFLLFILLTNVNKLTT